MSYSIKHSSFSTAIKNRETNSYNIMDVEIVYLFETLSTQRRRCASFNGAIKNVRLGLRNPYYFRVKAAAEVNAWSS